MLNWWYVKSPIGSKRLNTVKVVVKLYIFVA